MKRTPPKTLPLVLLLAAFSVPALAAPGGAAETAVLPAALRPVLYRTLARDALAAGTATIADGCAQLPGRRLEACFGPRGTRIRGAGGAALALRLVAFGRGRHPAAVTAVSPVMTGGAATFGYPAVTEWWHVLPFGLEQGFTIAHRPAGTGELTLALAANRPARTSGDGLAFGRLHYGDLVVTDAAGRPVPARLAAVGRRVLIAVNDRHATYPLTVDPLVLLEQKVSATDGASYDSFGYSVAISGTTAIVGATCATYNPVTQQCGPGAAYVFSESNGSWSQTAKLTPNDGAPYDNFGNGVAIDGTTALVGAPDASVNGNPAQGAVYVFTESGGTWTQAQKLLASDGAANNEFGTSVALQGGTALIGAIQLLHSTGVAYIFNESGGTWSQSAELTPSGGAGTFGDAVALDGDVALVGAQQTSVGGKLDQGAAFVYTDSGGTWSQTAELLASDGSFFDSLGASVALKGSTALVGAPGATVNGNQQGAAYVFTDDNGTWSQSQKLVAGDGAPQDGFGSSAALSGSTALVGADQYSNNGTGKVYLFAYVGGRWVQGRELLASDGADNDEFGWASALDGSTALIGAWGATVNGNTGQGAAYFYGASNLGLAVSAPASVGQGGSYVSQTIATNASSAASPAVAVTVTVPAAASFVSANASQGSCSEAAGVVNCAFGPIAGNGGNATANVTLKATGSSGTVIENTASVAQATPALTASAPTAISSCAAGYSEYDGTLTAGAHALEPDGQPYQAPAGQENGVLTAPAGFSLYVVYQGTGGRHVVRAPGNAVHRYGPAGTYAWVIKAGATGGSYTFCLMHP